LTTASSNNTRRTSWIRVIASRPARTSSTSSPKRRHHRVPPVRADHHDPEQDTASLTTAEDAPWCGFTMHRRPAVVASLNHAVPRQLFRYAPPTAEVTDRAPRTQMISDGTVLVSAFAQPVSCAAGRCMMSKVLRAGPSRFPRGAPTNAASRTSLSIACWRSPVSTRPRPPVAPATRGHRAQSDAHFYWCAARLISRTSIRRVIPTGCSWPLRIVDRA
jgi:hypothetical protein